MSSSKKPRQTGSEFNSTQQMLVQDANKTKKKQTKLQSQMIPATNLRTPTASADKPREFAIGDTTGRNFNHNYPTQALTYGKWIAKDPRDTRMKNLSDLNSQGSFGTIQAPTEEVLNWLETKQNQIYHQSLLELATALIDPNNPESQERAYSIMPALQKVPESHLKDEVAMQMSLNSILRDGVLRGTEDLQFIYHILSPDVELPMEPLWDLSGAFKSQREEAEKIAKTTKPSGIFSPFKYGYEETDKSARAKAQKNIKVAIVKRLFPALRALNFIETTKFLDNITDRRNEQGLPGEIGYPNAHYQKGAKFSPYGTMLGVEYEK